MKRKGYTDSKRFSTLKIENYQNNLFTDNNVLLQMVKKNTMYKTAI